MGIFKCPACGEEMPDFDVAHVCVTGPNAVILPPKKVEMWERGVFIHGYRLERTCYACPEQYDVFDHKDQMVAYLRLRHGGFRADVPDCGGETVYTANPNGDGIFDDEERVHYLTEAILAVQKYYLNRAWDEDALF